MRKILLLEDDELFALDVRMKLEQEFGEEAQVVHYRTAEDARHALISHKPDLLLSDVVLEDDKAAITLADLAQELGVPVVFMTAYQREDLFRLALKVNPSNYLQKPFTATQLRRALELAYKSSSQAAAEIELAIPAILLKGRQGVLEKILVKDILLIEAFGNYCHFHTAERRYTQRMPLKNFSSMVPVERFARIHRNYVINLEHLTSIDTMQGIVKLGEVEYPLSQKYKADLLRRFPRG